MDLGVAEFLNALCAELVAEGTSSRDLVAIEFDPDSDNVDVLTGMEPHLRSYPDLISILKAIGQTCSQDRIDAQQLRRISFLKEEIKLELVSRYGHQRIIYSYPIEEWRLLKGFSTEWLSGAGLRAHIFGIRAVMSILGGLAALVRWPEQHAATNNGDPDFKLLRRARERLTQIIQTVAGPNAIKAGKDVCAEAAAAAHSTDPHKKGPPDAGGPSSLSLSSYAAQSRRMRSSSVSLGL